MFNCSKQHCLCIQFLDIALINRTNLLTKKEKKNITTNQTIKFRRKKLHSILMCNCTSPFNRQSVPNPSNNILLSAPNNVNSTANKFPTISPKYLSYATRGTIIKWVILDEENLLLTKNTVMRVWFTADRTVEYRKKRTQNATCTNSKA